MAHLGVKAMRAVYGSIGMTLALFMHQPAATAQTVEPQAPVGGQADVERDAAPVLLDEVALRSTRGGQTIIINAQQLNAVTSGNVIGDYTAGDISFSDNALANFSGIGNFTINTGAQNNLQTAMILTVNISD